MAKIEPEFTKRNAKLIGLSVDPVETHARGQRTSRRPRAPSVKYPMIGDTDLAVAKLYNMLPAEEPGTLRRPHRGDQRRPCARCSSSARTRRSS